MRHLLKTWPRYFEAVKSGSKRFEARAEYDRAFDIGDTLILCEWDPALKGFTGESVEVRVTYILRGPAFGVEAGHVVMSIEPTPPAGKGE